MQKRKILKVNPKMNTSARTFPQHDLFGKPRGEDKVDWSLYSNDPNGVKSIYILITPKLFVGMDITLLGGMHVCSDTTHSHVYSRIILIN